MVQVGWLSYLKISVTLSVFILSKYEIFFFFLRDRNAEVSVIGYIIWGV
jgi:hypothetical protein